MFRAICEVYLSFNRKFPTPGSALEYNLVIFCEFVMDNRPLDQVRLIGEAFDKIVIDYQEQMRSGIITPDDGQVLNEGEFFSGRTKAYIEVSEYKFFFADMCRSILRSDCLKGGEVFLCFLHRITKVLVTAVINSNIDKRVKDDILANTAGIEDETQVESIFKSLGLLE